MRILLAAALVSMSLAGPAMAQTRVFPDDAKLLELIKSRVDDGRASRARPRFRPACLSRCQFRMQTAAVGRHNFCLPLLNRPCHTPDIVRDRLGLGGSSAGAARLYGAP